VSVDDEVDLGALEAPIGGTELLGAAGRPSVRRFALAGIDGAANGVAWESTGTTCAIGSHPSNDLVISDTAVSRFHCELRLEKDQIRVHDLDSTNGTMLDGVPVAIGIAREGSLIQLGRSQLRLHLGESYRVPVSARSEFGRLVGASWAMRAVFAVLERAAQTDATVLIEGESGTGKEGAAHSLHDHSRRADRPFVVIDCGAIPGNLLESELFGHEKGAFTGATDRRIGAFEAANGGTIFLDEIGELPTELQPKLLRVLEAREIRRVGGTAVHKIDVRIIAATNRDLRGEVNAGRFRPDLYFRIAVIKVALPPLRARPDDLPILVDRLVASLDLPPERAARLREPVFIASLGRGAWPGNVRELRNYLERAAILEGHDGGAEAGELAPYQEARDFVLGEFERRYVEQLLAAHKGNVSAAARASGIDRTYFHRLMRRHKLTR
jgi:transcriptional regulator with GAF, ATPase, and Fis domain